MLEALVLPLPRVFPRFLVLFKLHVLFFKRMSAAMAACVVAFNLSALLCLRGDLRGVVVKKVDVGDVSRLS